MNILEQDEYVFNSIKNISNKLNVNPKTGQLSDYHLDNCNGCSLCQCDDYKDYRDQEVNELNSK
jgi:hypothetical protein